MLEFTALYSYVNRKNKIKMTKTTKKSKMLSKKPYDYLKAWANKWVFRLDLNCWTCLRLKLNWFTFCKNFLILIQWNCAAWFCKKTLRLIEVDKKLRLIGYFSFHYSVLATTWLTSKLMQIFSAIWLAKLRLHYSTIRLWARDFSRL